MRILLNSAHVAIDGTLKGSRGIWRVGYAFVVLVPDGVFPCLTINIDAGPEAGLTEEQ